MRTVLLSLAALAVAAPVLAQTSAPTGKLMGNDGKQVGTVMVTPAPKGVIIRVEAQGLPEGWHGIHFHAKGDCSDVAKFQNSGGHVHDAGDGNLVHGLLNPKHNDSGDLTNIYVHKDGTVKAEIFSSFVTAGLASDSDKPALKDADGSALVIHASADDYTTQPIGGAGARIACAVLP